MSAPNSDTSPAANARLVYCATTPVSLPKVADQIGDALTEAGCGTPVQSDPTLTSLALRASDIQLTLGLSFVNDEAILAIKITPPPEQNDTQSHLPFLLYRLARDTPAKYVIWSGTELRIPRHQYLNALADKFEETDTQAHRETVRPRRVPVPKPDISAWSPCPEMYQSHSAHVMAYRAYLQKSAALKDPDMPALTAALLAASKYVAPLQNTGVSRLIAAERVN